MRQIEQDIVNFVRVGISFHSGTSSSYCPENTGYRDDLQFDEEKFSYRLWGNEIAKGDKSTKVITVSDCGYPTATTVSRLNAIFAGLDIPMSCMVRKKKMVYFLNGKEITDVEERIKQYNTWVHRAGNYNVSIVTGPAYLL